MAVDTKDEEVVYPKREWVANPKGLYEGYSNNIHANWSLFDVRILFGYLKPALGNSDKFVIEEQAAISLAWAQAKNLSQLLAGMVEAYESVNGEIPRLKLAPTQEELTKTREEMKKNES
jgi:hypothetical protein